MKKYTHAALTVLLLCSLCTLGHGEEAASKNQCIGKSPLQIAGNSSKDLILEPPGVSPLLDEDDQLSAAEKSVDPKMAIAYAYYAEKMARDAVQAACAAENHLARGNRDAKINAGDEDANIINQNTLEILTDMVNKISGSNGVSSELSKAKSNLSTVKKSKSASDIINGSMAAADAAATAAAILASTLDDMSASIIADTNSAMYASETVAVRSKAYMAAEWADLTTRAIQQGLGNSTPQQLTDADLTSNQNNIGQIDIDVIKADAAIDQMQKINKSNNIALPVSDDIDASNCGGYGSKIIVGSANVLDMGLRTCNTDSGVSASYSSTQRTANGSMIYVFGAIPAPLTGTTLGWVPVQETFLGSNGNVQLPPKSKTIPVQYYSAFLGQNWELFKRSGCHSIYCVIAEPGAFDSNAYIYTVQGRVRGGAYYNDEGLIKGNFLESSFTTSAYVPTASSGVSGYSYLTITPLYADERTDNLITPAEANHQAQTSLMGSGRGTRSRRSVATGFNWYPCAEKWDLLKSSCGDSATAGFLTKFYMAGALSYYKYYGGNNRPSFALSSTYARTISANYKIASGDNVALTLSFTRSYGDDMSIGLYNPSASNSISLKASYVGSSK